MTMHELKLSLKAVDPLVISRFAGSETSHATLDYLPGTAVLGALASAAVDAGWDTKAKDGEFHQCFLLGDVSFGDANPSPNGEPAVPAPRSWATIKGQEGFASLEDKHKSHVFDVAVFNRMHADRGEAQKAQAETIMSRGLPGLKESDAAETAKLEDIREGYVSDHTYFKIDRQVRTHTAIEKGKRSSKEGQLYSYESIPAGTQFTTTLRSISRDLLNKLSDLLPEDAILHFGRARSSGYGRTRVIGTEIGEFTQDQPTFSRPTILTLHGDLVLPHGCRGLEGALSRFHDIEAEKPLKGAWAQTRSVQSFHAKWGLPRDTAQAIVRGSVFLLDLDESSFNKLASLRQSGLGLRTHEGFGRFSLNDPQLHTDNPWRDEVRQREKQSDEHSGGEIKRPTESRLVPAFDRWLQRQADAFGERLLFKDVVSELLDSNDLIRKGQPSNSQLNALRMALAKGDDKARELFKDVKVRPSQWRKWDNCHVTSHFHGGKYGFGAYMATLLKINELAEKPRLSVDEWIAGQLNDDRFGERISDGLRPEFIKLVRRSFIDQLIRNIVGKRRIPEKQAVKEAAHD